MAEELYQDNYRTIYCGDSRQMAELPDESVQCVVTSPPYWGLRKYTGEQELIWADLEGCQHEWGKEITRKQSGGGWAIPKDSSTYDHDIGKTDFQLGVRSQGSFCSLCGAWRGSYGLEPTPEMYIDHTILILREIKRVLRKDGVVFWNIADSYAGGGRGSDKKYGEGRDNQPKSFKGNSLIKPKDLSLIPFRLAIAAQADGWWVRSVIIWSKPNPMPESAKDRPTTCHEYILMLTKSARYYWDADAVREPSNGELAEDISNLLKEAGKMVGKEFDPEYYRQFGCRYCEHLVTVSPAGKEWVGGCRYRLSFPSCDKWEVWSGMASERKDVTVGAERIRTRFMETAKDAVETALEQLDEVVKVGWEEKLSGEERALLDRLLGVWTGLTEEMRIIYLVMGIKSKQESPDDELGEVVKALENAEVISG